MLPPCVCECVCLNIYIYFFFQFIYEASYVNVLQLLMDAGYTIFYEHFITQQLISAIAGVHVTKQPSSEEWHIAVDP